MGVFDRLVVGLDGSLAASEALNWAVARTGAAGEIHVVMAAGTDPEIVSSVDPASMQTTSGAPAESLIHLAREVHADAIVVGPHGSGLGRGLGSVARHLLADALLPVLVVDGEDLDSAPRPGAPVVACIGYGEPAKAALHWAAHYAAERELPLGIVHAVAYRPVFPLDSASDMLASYLGAGVATEWAKSDLETTAAELKTTHPGLEVTVRVEPLSAKKAVERAGAGADLVVLGKRGGDSFVDTLGTPRLRRIVARSSFPTAVIPVSVVS